MRVTQLRGLADLTEPGRPSARIFVARIESASVPLGLVLQTWPPSCLAPQLFGRFHHHSPNETQRRRQYSPYPHFYLHCYNESHRHAESTRLFRLYLTYQPSPVNRTHHTNLNKQISSSATTSRLLNESVELLQQCINIPDNHPAGHPLPPLDPLLQETLAATHIRRTLQKSHYTMKVKMGLVRVGRSYRHHDRLKVLFVG